MMLPELICNHLDELCRSLSCSWSWNGECFQGLSQARTFPIHLGKQRYALRNWNWGAERYREVNFKIDFQRRLNQQWPKTLGGSLVVSKVASESTSMNPVDCPIPAVFNFASAGNAIAIADDSLWTLSTWQPGVTLCENDELRHLQMQSVVHTLATMHLISLQHTCSLERSIGWNDRCERLQQLKQRATAFDIRQNANLHERTVALIASLKAIGLIDELSQFANDQAVKSYPSCWIVRDTHYQNWLFVEDDVSGFVDFAAAKLDWFGWDLMRFFSSCELQHSQVCELMLFYEEQLARKPVAQLVKERESLAPLSNTAMWTKLEAIQMLLSIDQWKEWNSTQQLSATAVSRWRRLLFRAERQLIP